MNWFSLLLLLFLLLALPMMIVVPTPIEPHFSNDTTFTSATTIEVVVVHTKVDDEIKSCPSKNVSGRRNINSPNIINDFDPAHEANHHRCGLYVAVSTIPGAGLGAFTGIDRQPGDVIGPGDAMIPLYDVMYHLQALGRAASQRDDWDYIDPTRDYVWFGIDLGMQYESAHPYEYISGISYGLDTIINCHLALVNAKKKYASYDFANLHRSIDPGIGAFTPYHSARTSATRRIEAGSELFKSYGDQWFIDRTDAFGLLPLTKDYKIVEATLQKLQQIMDHGDLPSDVRVDLYERFVLANPHMNTSRTLLTMPKEYDDIQYVANNGIQEYCQQCAIHTIDYLQRHGRCVDTIEPHRSTLRQAGRGAFAARSFQKN